MSSNPSTVALNSVLCFVPPPGRPNDPRLQQGLAFRLIFFCPGCRPAPHTGGGRSTAEPMDRHLDMLDLSGFRRPHPNMDVAR